MKEENKLNKRFSLGFTGTQAKWLQANRIKVIQEEGRFLTMAEYIRYLLFDSREEVTV